MSENRVSLTERRVKDATMPEGVSEYWLFDQDPKNFGLRMQRRADGSIAKVYAIRYRVPGVSGSKKYRIGDPAKVSLEWARNEATKLNGRMSSARQDEQAYDPVAVARAQREQEKRERAVDEVAESYFSRKLSEKKKSVAAMRRTYDRHISKPLGRKKLRDVTRDDVERLHSSMQRAGKPVAANRVVAILSAILSHGGRRGETNPCRDVERFEEEPRQRYLNDEEFQRLGEALDAAEAQGGESLTGVRAIRLLLLTGCRKSEILALKWEYMRWERSGIDFPSEVSKTGAKTTPIGEAALVYLAELREEVHREGRQLVGFVFPGDRYKQRVNKGGHFVGLFHIWNRIRIKAGIPDVRLHDLRHSYASVAVSGGEGLMIVGRILGHTNFATTQRYAHLSDDPVKRAADTTSNEIAAKLGRGRVVVPFRAAS